MEAFLYTLANGLALFVEAVAVVIVGAGAAGALVRLVRVELRPATHGARKEVWRSFGMWLLFGLEFELAADIIRSVISPSWQEIGRLAAIAVIRTFLNYFLEKDLDDTEKAAVPAA